jgi:hypothetical protein
MLHQRVERADADQSGREEEQEDDEGAPGLSSGKAIVEEEQQRWRRGLQTPDPWDAKRSTIKPCLRIPSVCASGDGELETRLRDELAYPDRALLEAAKPAVRARQRGAQSAGRDPPTFWICRQDSG